MRNRTPLGGVIKALRYMSFDWNTHPIDMVEESHGFGPFKGPWSPWEFEDPASSIDCGYTGSNVELYQPSEAQAMQIFTDPSTDRTNQILAAIASNQSGGFQPDIFSGMGQGGINLL